MGEVLLGFVAFVLLAPLVFLLIRNEVVYRVRGKVLDDCTGLPFRRYDTLPSYDDMYACPRYWHLWTTAQWQRWIDERLDR